MIQLQMKPGKLFGNFSTSSCIQIQLLQKNCVFLVIFLVLFFHLYFIIIALGGSLCPLTYASTYWLKSLSGEVSDCRGFQWVLSFTVTHTSRINTVCCRNCCTMESYIFLIPWKSCFKMAIKEHTIYFAIANVSNNRMHIIFGKVVSEISGCMRWAWIIFTMVFLVFTGNKGLWIIRTWLQLWPTLQPKQTF